MTYLIIYIIWLLGFTAMRGYTRSRYTSRFNVDLNIHPLDRMVICVFWPLAVAYYLGRGKA